MLKGPSLYFNKQKDHQPQGERGHTIRILKPLYFLLILSTKPYLILKTLPAGEERPPSRWETGLTPRLGSKARA